MKNSSILAVILRTEERYVETLKTEQRYVQTSHSIIQIG
jgi:hypothetical protein